MDRANRVTPPFTGTLGILYLFNRKNNPVTAVAASFEPDSIHCGSTSLLERGGHGLAPPRGIQMRLEQ